MIEIELAIDGGPSQGRLLHCCVWQSLRIDMDMDMDVQQWFPFGLPREHTTRPGTSVHRARRDGDGTIVRHDDDDSSLTL
jgi:hypothetical protein